MKVATKQAAGRLLRKLGWTSYRGLWKTDKRGLKRHTAHGLTLREAASIEWIEYPWVRKE
jgi:hypothetical protein